MNIRDGPFVHKKRTKAPFPMLITRREKKMRAIIAAAGTAGHINPGLAIANKIKKEEPNSEILFIGTNRGLENDLVQRAGYKLEHVEAYGLGKNMKNNLKTFKGIFQAKKIIRNFNPDIVIGAGGYICGPAIIAAHMEKKPTMLHESNAFPGKAVKLLAGITDTILISFEEARERIKKAKNIVLTGTPIKRPEILKETRKQKVLSELGVNDDKPIVLIFGGSQGAKKINEAVVELLSKNQELNYQIILSAGAKQYDKVMELMMEKQVDITKSGNIRIFPYIYNMPEVEQVADVLVCRSGATTIAEISAIGKPAIFVPLPNVSNDHQTYNAKVLENLGAASIIDNAELTGDKLNDRINSMIKNKSNLKVMGEKAKEIAIIDAEDRIYKEVKKILK